MPQSVGLSFFYPTMSNETRALHHTVTKVCAVRGSVPFSCVRHRNINHFAPGRNFYIFIFLWNSLPWDGGQIEDLTCLIFQRPLQKWFNGAMALLKPEAGFLRQLITLPSSLRHYCMCQMPQQTEPSCSISRPQFPGRRRMKATFFFLAFHHFYLCD